MKWTLNILTIESKRGNRANLVGQNSPEYGGLSIEVDYRTGSLLTRGCSYKIDAEKGKQTTSQGPTSVAPNALKSMVPPLHGKLVSSIHVNQGTIHISRMFIFCYHYEL